MEEEKEEEEEEGEETEEKGGNCGRGDFLLFQWVFLSLACRAFGAICMRFLLVPFTFQRA